MKLTCLILFVLCGLAHIFCSEEYSNAFIKIHGTNNTLSRAQLDNFFKSIAYNDSEYADHTVSMMKKAINSCSICNSTCVDAGELFRQASAANEETIDAQKLALVLPQVFYRIQNPRCYTKAETKKLRERPTAAQTWGFGFLFVSLINLCALLGIIFLPFMRMKIYKLILTFMVALAVGSLLGSALLFLIPETLQLADVVEKDPEFDGYLYKATVVAGGVYMFFLLERFLKIVIGIKRKGPAHGHSHDAATRPSVSEVDEAWLAVGGAAISENGEPLHKPAAKLSEPQPTRQRYPSCSMNIARESSVDPQLKIPPQRCISSCTKQQCNGCLADDATNEQSAQDACLLQLTSESKQRHNETNVVAVSTLSSADKNLKDNDPMVDDGSNMDPEANAAVEAKKPVAPVAWMIIFGDGVHNFIDGLSIGAAFSTTVVSGISISLSVLCEELPHELGDFAILLNSGMSMKQALGWNFLSACMCYCGLMVGILLGELTDGSVWVFAIAGGMFLYISLVDMLPEVNQAMETEDAVVLGRGKIFLLQNLGLLTGFGMLLLLALYGGDIYSE